MGSLSIDIQRLDTVIYEQRLGWYMAHGKLSAVLLVDEVSRCRVAPQSCDSVMSVFTAQWLARDSVLASCSPTRLPFCPQEILLGRGFTAGGGLVRPGSTALSPGYWSDPVSPCPW